jgi:hypothetical protein
MVDFMENIRTNMDDLKVPLADLENFQGESPSHHRFQDEYGL